MPKQKKDNVGAKNVSPIQDGEAKNDVRAKNVSPIQDGEAKDVSPIQDGEAKDVSPLLPFEKWKVKEEHQAEVREAFQASGLKSPDEVFALKIYIEPHPGDIVIISVAGKKYIWRRPA